MKISGHLYRFDGDIWTFTGIRWTSTGIRWRYLSIGARPIPSSCIQRLSNCQILLNQNVPLQSIFRHPVAVIGENK